MISPIHSLATSAANAVEAALQVPRQFALYAEDPDALAANLPPQVQQALAQIDDPDQRYLMTLIARGDVLPAGVPANVPGPDLSQGTAGVTDYLGRLLEAMRAARRDPNADDLTEDLDQSIADVEDLLRKIDPNHPALLGQNAPTTGKLDLLA